MKRVVQAFLLTVICILLLSAAGSAQVKCPEGRSWTGGCVNPALAATARHLAIIFSQPKISRTAFPILPTEDHHSRYPNQLIPNPARPSPAFSVSP